MFAYSIIEAYMKAKNYTQAKQAAADLGFDASMISNIKRGAKKLPEESAIYMAERCGMDVDEVMLKLRAEQAKSESEKAVWERILKKYKHGMNPTISLTISGLLASLPSLNDFALCILC